ncbi:YxiG-like protein [Micromonospora musae]|uniref:YxiG-like protein n=1 Tax=Micromonospora musae TaxID=1894970 RepID=UPI00341821C3
MTLSSRLDPEIGPDLDGHVWAVRWQPLYPGAQLVADSRRAQGWAEQVGIDFHEVRIEMNGHNLNLIFSELEVRKLAPGYAPYMVTEGEQRVPLACPI